MRYNAPARLFFTSKVTQNTDCAYCIGLRSKVLICCFTSQQNPYPQRNSSSSTCEIQVQGLVVRPITTHVSSHVVSRSLVGIMLGGKVWKWHMVTMAQVPPGCVHDGVITKFSITVRNSIFLCQSKWQTQHIIHFILNL